MEYFPAALEKLVEQFARLPGIGSKSAQRLAFFVLSLPEEEAKAFADAIVDAKRTVTFCPVCRNLTDGGLCPICSSPKRDEHVICVVADPRDVVAIERAREYNGRWYTDIRAWRLQPKQEAASAPMPDMPPIVEEPSYASSPAQVDDLPF